MKFHIFYEKEDSREVSVPMIIYWWHLLNFIMVEDAEAAAYIAKVSQGIRSYGPADSEILQVLHQDEFPVKSFIEKYFHRLPEERIARHTEWSESIKGDLSFTEKSKGLESLIPDLA